MGRRKKNFKLPFFKAKINRKTVANIVGFILIIAAILLILSFASLFSSDEGGVFLTKINYLLVGYFGGLAVFIPLIILLFSAHFFNSRKLKIIKFNLSLGSVMIFISLLGLFRSGSIGEVIYSSLRMDFSLIGGLAILSAIFLIGIILFFDTSVDVFALFLFSVLKKIIMILKTYFFRGLMNSKRGQSSKKEVKEKVKPSFIKDKLLHSKTKKSSGLFSPSASPPSSHNEEILIRPLRKNSADSWVYPPITLLRNLSQQEADRGDVSKNAATIERTLDSFGIRSKIVDLEKGPTVTQYAIEITTGTKLSKITSLANDLALALAAPTGQIRIEAPIPGRSLIGIEVPNVRSEIVTLKRILLSKELKDASSSLAVPLGLNIAGNPQVVNLGDMPHILIAGATGSGKSVLLNSWISTILFRTKPQDVRLILVDPKRVELTLYNGVPHLLTEVVVEADKIISSLSWTVSEMENRYKEFAKAGVRNLESYNELPSVEKKPYILFIIDELADLMMFSPRKVEELITRIAQMARATGIHLILATQRPSVDVITGLMKANIPARVAFNVSSMIDSRVIIDTPGAEKLLGHGDMLFMSPSKAKPVRIQGPFITETEVKRLVDFLKAQTPEVHYTEEVTNKKIVAERGKSIDGRRGDGRDVLFNQALQLALQLGKASASLLQRRLSIGYARAARILDQLEEAGYVGPAEGSKPREVLQRQSEEDSGIEE